MKSLVLKLSFIGVVACFCLLVGGLLGGTVMRSHGGHGLAALGSMLIGAFIGLVIGFLSAISTLIGMKPGQSSMNKMTMVFLTGSLVLALCILALDHFGYW
jgi:hypothetical protein